MNDKEFLIDLRAYIEYAEVKIDSDWGMARELRQIIDEGDMPALYAEVIRRISIIENGE